MDWKKIKPCQQTISMSHPSKNQHHASTSITMEIHNIFKIKRRRKVYKCVCDPRGIQSILSQNEKFNCRQNLLDDMIGKRTKVVEKSKLYFPNFVNYLYMYIFGFPRGIPCGTLWNTKS